MAEEPDDEGPDVATPPAPAAPAAVPAVPEWLTGAQATPTAVPAPGPAPGTVDSLLVTPEQSKALQDRLAEIKRNQMAASDKGTGETVARLRRDRAEMEQAYKATALPPDTLQPWDQKAKQNEYRTDPVEAFGSIGSVFAMLVPAFVGLPMEAALNAGAAAINAVHAQDEKAYDRDFKSWKENNDLALKRHEIMRQAYNDSILKMNTNLNAGRSELELNARKFGDQQVLAMLEAGMDPDVMKAVEARNKAALELKSTSDRVWLEHEKVEDLKKDPMYWVAKNTGNQAMLARVLENHNERWAPQGSRYRAYDAERELVRDFDMRNPGAGKEERDAYILEARKKIAGQDAAGTPGTPDGPDKRLTGPQYDQQQIAAREKKLLEENPGMDPIEANNRARQDYLRSKSVPSGNEVNRMRGKIDQIDNVVNGSEKNLEFLRSYKGGAGLLGSVMRGVEVSTNITGLSTQSDRVQFRRRVKELQDIVPQILTDSAGRPLKSAQEKVDALVAGLNAGDTGPNTIRAYEDLVEDMRKRARDYDRRITTPYSTPGVAGGANPEGKKPPPSAEPWKRDKIKRTVPDAPGPRSSLDQPTMSDADPESVSPGAQYAMMPPSTVSKPTMVRYQPPSVADRLDGGMFELDEIAAKLTPRMQKKLKKYAEKLAARD